MNDEVFTQITVLKSLSQWSFMGQQCISSKLDTSPQVELWLHGKDYCIYDSRIGQTQVVKYASLTDSKFWAQNSSLVPCQVTFSPKSFCAWLADDGSTLNMKLKKQFIGGYIICQIYNIDGKELFRYLLLLGFLFLQPRIYNVLSNFYFE